MTAYWSVCCRILWTAGAVAAVGTITYPAISVYVSANASPDQQGRRITVFVFFLGFWQFTLNHVVGHSFGAW